MRKVTKILTWIAIMLGIICWLLLFRLLLMLIFGSVEVKAAEPAKLVTGFEEDTEEYWDALEELALITLAEAGNQSDYGQQLVIDVILNRVQSDKFPDTIPEVIEQKGQFAAYKNGAILRQEMNEKIAALVMGEIENKKNSEVLFFQCGGYHRTPVVKEGAHYFSK